jgi:hypothetical protein
VAALVLFFAGFEGFFVAVVGLHGPTLTREISWTSVLTGNLLATAAMLGYFRLRHPELARALLGPWLRVVREGAVAGLIGAVTTAVWFVIWDALARQPFHTPALLGAALLHGLRDPAALEVSVPLVLSYTVLHGAAFLAFGVVAAVVVAAAERRPVLLLALLVLFTCFEVFFLGIVTLLDEVLVSALGWWTIFLANVLAAVAMLAFFTARHRGLPGRLVTDWSR